MLALVYEGRAVWAADDVVRGTAILRRAADVADAVGEPFLVAHASWALADGLRSLDQPTEAVRVARRALDASIDVGSPSLQAHVHGPVA